MRELYADIKRLVEIPSVLSDTRAHMPFGENISRALDEMLLIAEEKGMEVYRDPEGYYGYAQVGGKSDRLFGVLCHLDVVPAGNVSDWHHPPFEMWEDEEYLYGRGVQDDKGPTVLALHALLDLMKEGKELSMPVRFIFGTDEENLWRGIDQYKKDRMQRPVMGFTPDSGFPLTFAEKGLWQVNLIGQGGAELDFQGGVAYNVVPGEAPYDHPPVSLLQQLEQRKIPYEETSRGVAVLGKNVHSAKAMEGRNALVDLLSTLHYCNIKSPAAQLVAERLQGGVDGSKIFSRTEDTESGLMTVNLGLVDLNQEREILKMDIRYPVSLSFLDLQDELVDVAKQYGFYMETHDHQPPLHLAIDNPLIQTLMEAYQEVTGDTESRPMVSGGATYARAMEQFVAFGAILPGAEETEHQPNERMSKKEMEKAYQIYQRAFEKLVMK